MKELTPDLLQEFSRSYAQKDGAQTLHTMLYKTDMADLSYVPLKGAALKGAFSVEVKTRGITAQEQSGRCWLFAALNILREKVAEKCKRDEFELSQNYLSFYDKLEKSNNVLQMVIDHAHEPIKGELMQYVLQGVADGGYWCEAVDLVEKYGVVPKQVQPETYQSSHTARFVSTINRLVRKDAWELRELVLAGKDPYARKKEMMQEIYDAQCIAFGEPVQTFDFSYRDKDKVYHEERNLTPLDFYHQYVEGSLRDYVAIVNEPTEIMPLNKPIQFHGVENMVGRDMLALNLPQKEMEALCVKQLEAGDAIWFACDAGAYGARKEGVWDPESVCCEALLGGFSTAMPKGRRLEYNSSSATHAMILVGVHFDETGVPDRWKIENSWGKDVGDGGYFVCSEKYFEDFVYEAVIHKKHLTEAQRKMLEEEPVIINAWDEDH